jgi:hypothetical protein
MQMGVLMPGKGMLGSGKAIIPPDKGILMSHNGKGLCEARACWSEARASV